MHPPCGSLHASVWDLTSTDSLPENIVEGTVDMIIIIFVMSALHPDEMAQAVKNVHRASAIPVLSGSPLKLYNQMLNKGGRVLFRDYGRHDMAQLRFKAGRLLQDNFYIRGDKTRVYFFDLGERCPDDVKFAVVES